MTTVPLQNGPRASSPRVLLLSTYELGHQPFGLASPAAWLRAEGADVTCVDVDVVTLEDDTIRAADLVGVYLPMHTATRLAVPLIQRVLSINPQAHVCAYGLYAPVNEEMLRQIGVKTVLGGEFEEPLTALVAGLSAAQAPVRQLLPVISLGRQEFRVPDRAGLPALGSYASLQWPDGSSRVVGYTEATRGCKHMCRHCPIVPVYNGQFRVVQRDVVDQEVANLVEEGAQHITFGDPDFFNGPRHAIDVVQKLHDRFPGLTYDVTIKVEHLLAQASLLPRLRDTGCVLVTTAVESFDEKVLDYFEKRHTSEDFVTAQRLLAEAGVALNPTFVAFTPWTTRESYTQFLMSIHEFGLVDSVAPVQYAIRLLLPAGSRLLELPEMRMHVGEYDPQGLCHRWSHPDPAMDTLQDELFSLVEVAVEAAHPRGQVFDAVRAHTAKALGGELADRLNALPASPRGLPTVPYLSEPWFCCAEPTRGQLEPML
ncbi:radical SAM protein [Rhizocola hellebori]|uniref:Radical SAM protein n=1 Tax=Rhizocola hellebori TaxID=1392758 RepID=A0A8J3Q447_9ACTN|nr:CUAEP/CCAEP-tail radical SAM protein [Rhizocola hellebori]GIH03419.1 radical SAM protein [Rhizocola hellebori]